MIELLSSSTETSSGAGTPVDLGEVDRFLSVSVVVESLTGTMMTVIESSASETGPWTVCGDTTDARAFSVIALGRWVRLRWIGAAAGVTPFSATFSATADIAHCYATLADLTTFGLPEPALRGVSASTKSEALRAASKKADTKLGIVYDLPLLSWDYDLREAVAKIAAYDLLSFRGFNPDGEDANVRTRHNDANELLRQVANLQAKLSNIVDSTPEVDDSGIAVVSRTPRRWRGS